MSSNGPTVSRRQLGAALRHFREEAGLEAKGVAGRLKTSHSRLSRIESGKQAKITSAEVHILCRWYGVDDKDQIQALLDMLRNSRKQGWWASFELPTELETYIGLESDAISVRAWESRLIHGLAQTPEYARAVLMSRPGVEPDRVASRVEARLMRQRILTREDRPLDYQVILDEGVLMRRVGGPAVMRSQLDHLITISGLPNVVLQVVPFDRGVHDGVAGPFSLLSFGEGIPAVVHAETPVASFYVEKPREVGQFTGTFDRLGATALSPDDSITLIQHMRGKYQ